MDNESVRKASKSKKGIRMKNKVLILIGVMIFSYGISSAQPVTEDVSAVPLWTDTGIAVTNGEAVDVNSSGFWAWTGLEPFNDPDGNLDYANPVYYSGDLWLADNLHGSLVAFVGSNPYQDSGIDPGGVYQTNEYWPIGTAGQFISNTNGELWLGFNDDAYTGATYDNGGTNVASIAVGFDTNGIPSPLTLTITMANTNQFGFFISNGVPNTVCAIYDTADLTHWTLIDALVLDANGTSAGASDCNPPCPGNAGLISGNFVNNTGVPYRFYKVTDGQFVSRTIGFSEIWVGPGTTNSPGVNSLIANQFDDPFGNTLDGIFSNLLFNANPSLPAGTVLSKWDTTAQAYDYYTWNGTGSGWGTSGGITLNPGEAAFLSNLTTSNILITFVGLVREGESSLAITTNQLASSILPKAGLVQSILGYVPHNSDKIFIWNSGTYNAHSYNASLNKWSGFNGEPKLNVGEGFFIEPGATNVWNEYYSSHQF